MEPSFDIRKLKNERYQFAWVTNGGVLTAQVSVRRRGERDARTDAEKRQAALDKLRAPMQVSEAEDYGELIDPLAAWARRSYGNSQSRYRAQ